MKITKFGEFSFNDIRTMLEQALNPAGDFKNWVQDVYPDKCIVNMSGDLYEISYAIKEGKAELGEKKRVKVAYEALAELNDIEIFEAGTYRGKTYTDTDLDTMVKNFDELKDLIKPVAVIGHDEEQDLLKKSGLFSAGKMESVKKIGKKLVASFKNVPQVLAEIIKNGGYSRISSEIYDDYDGKGYALRRVAILGGDIPEVKTLQDIAALYAEGAQGKTTWVSLAEADPESGKKENTMKCASCGKDVGADAKFCPHCGAKATTQESMAEEMARLRTENTQLLEKEKSAVTKLSEEQARIKKAEIHTFCESLKSAGKLTPAMQEIGIEAFMEALDGTTVRKFAEDKEGVPAAELSPLGFFMKFMESFGESIKFGEVAPAGKGDPVKLADDATVKAIASASPKEVKK